MRRAAAAAAVASCSGKPMCAATFNIYGDDHARLQGLATPQVSKACSTVHNKLVTAALLAENSCTRVGLVPPVGEDTALAVRTCICLLMQFLHKP
jgi:hypothetical protein